MSKIIVDNFHDNVDNDIQEVHIDDDVHFVDNSSRVDVEMELRVDLVSINMYVDIDI